MDMKNLDFKELEKLVRQDVRKILLEEEQIAASEHKKQERTLLIVRNALVFAAAALFITELILHNVPRIKGIAYMFGAGGYLSQLLLMTDCFRRKLDHAELFMAYCFGPLYILMGLSYILK